MKKIISALLMASSLFASNNIYLDKKDYSNNDFRIFAGIDGKYAYFNSDITTDQTMVSYGLYVGLPIFNDYELIINKNQDNTRDFTINQQSITINMPLDSRQSRRAYLGIKAGNGTVDFDDNIADLDNKFYAIHIGKRYKYTRHYRVRIELEATNYRYDNNINDTAFSFNYGFEYRF
jgi:hypothetical protein